MLPSNLSEFEFDELAKYVAERHIERNPDDPRYLWIKTPQVCEEDLYISNFITFVETDEGMEFYTIDTRYTLIKYISIIFHNNKSKYKFFYNATNGGVSSYTFKNVNQNQIKYITFSLIAPNHPGLLTISISDF